MGSCVGSIYSDAIADTVVAMAKEIQKTPAQVALNWVRQKNPRIIPIIGAKTVAQLNDNFGCLAFTLSDQQMKKLDDANPLPPVFPEGFLTSAAMRQLLYGDITISQ